MKRLNEIFTVTYGVNLEFYKLTPDNGINSINYVSRTKKNNGVSARVERIEGLVPNPANTLSIALTGSVLEVFLQEEEYYSGRDIAYLTPIEDMDKYTMLMYCTLIRQNQFKYSQGRGANTTVECLLLPSPEELKRYKTYHQLPDISTIPDYFLNEGYEKACWYMDNIDQKAFESKFRPAFKEKSMSLNTSDWAEFDLKDGDFFKISRGERLKSVDRQPGTIPFYSASQENNGIVDYISNPLFVESNALIYTIFGDCFYAKDSFSCSDDTSIIKYNGINPYNALFVCSIINLQKYKYSFGRKAFYEKFSLEKIKLPVIEDGTPDFEFMENYIKSLPYSANI